MQVPILFLGVVSNKDDAMKQVNQPPDKTGKFFSPYFLDGMDASVD